MLAHALAALLAWLSWIVGRRTKRPSDIGTEQTVVIVGGGFAGLTLAHYLESSTGYRVVVVEKRDYFEYTPAMLRVMREPEHMSVSHLRHSDIKLLQRPRVRIVQDEVVQVRKGEVVTKRGDAIAYDKLVLAMGSDYPDHLKPEPCCVTLTERASHIAGVHASLEDAKRITIFGGGLVGVELAAEIVERWPNTPLTFRQREPYLLPGFPAKAQEYARAFFERCPNVQLIFGNTVPPFKYAPEGPPGEEIVFNCTGIKSVSLPNTDVEVTGAAETKEQQEAHMTATPKSPRSPRRNSSKKKKSGRSASPASSPRTSASPSVRNNAVSSAPLISLPIHERTSLLRITPTLHLVGHDNIFAVGDVMVEDDLLDEPARRLSKVAYQAELQAWCVAENLKRQDEGRREWNFLTDLIGAPVAPSLVCCSLGKRDGIVIFNQIVLGGWISVLTNTMLEHTKMMQLRGNFFGECVWTVLEPLSLLQHRILLYFTGAPQATPPAGLSQQ